MLALLVRIWLLEEWTVVKFGFNFVLKYIYIFFDGLFLNIQCITNVKQICIFGINKMMDGYMLYGMIIGKIWIVVCSQIRSLLCN